MIERVEIDGRSGLAAYVDDKFKPVEKDVATLIKILFDDGEQLILSNRPPRNDKPADKRAWLRAKTEAESTLSRLRIREWDESEHPREPDGKFTESGGDGGGSGGERDAEDVSEFAAPAQGVNGHGDTRPGVNGYAGTMDSFWINKALRQNLLGDHPETKKVIDALTNEIDQSITTADRVVSRGVQEYFAEQIVKGGPGTVIQDKGFISATREESWAERMFARGGGAVLNISVPKGSKMLTVAKSGEDEVIFPRDTALKITSVTQREGVWRIGAELVQ